MTDTKAKIMALAGALVNSMVNYSQGVEARPDKAGAALEAAIDELVLERDGASRKALPAEMPGCTILFKECEKGHGWLTATNWEEQHECQVCRTEKAEAERERLAKYLLNAESAIRALKMKLHAAPDAALKDALKDARRIALEEAVAVCEASLLCCAPAIRALIDKEPTT